MTTFVFLKMRILGESIFLTFLADFFCLFKENVSNFKNFWTDRFVVCRHTK